MENPTALLLATPLFAGITGPELDAMLPCLHPVRRRAARGEVLLACGQENHSLGIVLSGSIEAVRPLPGGGRIPVSHMGAGGVFGDVLGGAGLRSPVTVTAAEACEVLLFPYDALLSPCARLCPAHGRLVQNLLAAVGRKYFQLFSRIELLTLKSLRAKIALYLLGEAAQAGADTFTIPYSRAALAEYLGCERSALSRELSRMQADGLLETYKSSFKLRSKAALEQLCQA